MAPFPPQRGGKAGGPLGVGTGGIMETGPRFPPAPFRLGFDAPIDRGGPPGLCPRLTIRGAGLPPSVEVVLLDGSGHRRRSSLIVKRIYRLGCPPSTVVCRFFPEAGERISNRT